MAENPEKGHKPLHRRAARSRQGARPTEADNQASTATEENDPKIHPVIASSAEIADARVRDKKAAHQAALKAR